MELENFVQSVLQDAGIEVDIKTLQNPTEEFMTCVIIEYLRKFRFDGNEIAKPTPEQLGRVSDEESIMNAIKSINLHAALTTICDKIFLKDLMLTDITSPGCKKACKRIKVLFNFYIYVRNKNMENESLFNQLDCQQKEIEDKINQKAELTGKIGSMINERENKLELIKKLKKDIVEVKSQIGKNAKKSEKLQKNVDDIAAKRQEELQKLNALKAKAQELHKINKDLQSKIVKSPEEYVTRTKDLKKMLEDKMEERQALNDCINRKKVQIQSNELAESEVKNSYNKMLQVGEIMAKLNETILRMNATKKQYDDLKEEIMLMERKRNTSINDSNTTDPVDLEKSQRLLLELHNSHAQKSREHENLKKKLEQIRSEQRKSQELLQKEKEQISLVTSEYSKLLKDFKAYHNNQLTEEMNLRKEFNELLK